MNRREFVSFGVVALAATTMGLSGCGGAKKSPRGVVKFGGTATYDGKPLPKGVMIMFTPKEGRQSAATTTENGAFYAKYSTAEDGVEHGTLKVTVGWDEEVTGGPIAEDFADLIKNYSTADQALEITVEKADTEYKLDFPKK